MLRHLNTFMSSSRNWDKKTLLRFEDQFLRVAKLIATSLVKPFRPRHVINAAVLEAVFIALMEEEDIGAKKVKRNYPKLITDENFLAYASGTTTDTSILQGRIKIAKTALSK